VHAWTWAIGAARDPASSPPWDQHRRPARTTASITALSADGCKHPMHGSGEYEVRWRRTLETRFGVSTRLRAAHRGSNSSASCERISGPASGASSRVSSFSTLTWSALRASATPVRAVLERPRLAAPVACLSHPHKPSLRVAPDNHPVWSKFAITSRVEKAASTAKIRDHPPACRAWPRIGVGASRREEHVAVERIRVPTSTL